MRVAVAAQPLRVLFIGNSFTSGGNLPRLVEELSIETSRPIDTEMVAPGGVYLAWHAENPATLEKLGSGKWDYVVLQDCSTCPLDYRDSFRAGVKEMVKKARNVRATPLLFMTWADLHKQGDIEVLAREYSELGTELDVGVVPVGLAWKSAVARLGGTSFFEPDGHHASLTGALLSSYVFLGVLQKNSDQPTRVRLRKSPELVYHLLFPIYQAYADESQAQSLKQIAAQTLKVPGSL